MKVFIAVEWFNRNPC